jgi:hypothetical protein
MCDPVVGRMLSTDNNINGAYSTIGYDRYSYALNNPLKYTDPDGEFVQYVIGGIMGAISGFQVGQSKGAKGLKMFGYILGGAAIGALSGGIGNTISTSGVVGAKTLSIIGASMANSLGMKMLSVGATDFSISYGFGAFNFDKGKNSILWGAGNSKMQNWGYAFANLSDAFALAKGVYAGKAKDVMLVTNNDPPISHVAITTPEGKTLISYGPSRYDVSNKQFLLGGTSGTNRSPNYYVDTKKWNIVKMRVRNIRIDKMQKFAFNNLVNSDYSILRFGGYSCVSAASRGLWHAGFFHIPFVNTPITLETQIFISNNIFLSSLITNKN